MFAIGAFQTNPRRVFEHAQLLATSKTFKRLFECLGHTVAASPCPISELVFLTIIIASLGRRSPVSSSSDQIESLSLEILIFVKQVVLAEVTVAAVLGAAPLSVGCHAPCCGPRRPGVLEHSESFACNCALTLPPSIQLPCLPSSSFSSNPLA